MCGLRRSIGLTGDLQVGSGCRVKQCLKIGVNDGEDILLTGRLTGQFVILSIVITPPVRETVYPDVG